MTLDIFALNDTHGNVKDTEEKGLGIAKTTTLLKQLSRNKNSVFISQGDMWQGSVESNYTKGNLVTEWMNSLDFVSMTVGNHEFDWGADAIKQNSSIANFPTLGINVVNKSTGQRVDYLEPSTTFTRAGAKIGVVGAIGNCLGSISGSKVKGLTFVTGDALTELVKDEATRLRNEEHCDFVIYSYHGSGSRDEEDDYDIALSSGGYVDLVLEGHTHDDYAEIDEAGIYHVQCRAYNRSIYQITVDLDLTNKSVSVATPINYNLSNEYSPYKNIAEDSETNALFTKYYDYYSFAYQDVGYVSTRKSGEELRNKIAELYFAAGKEKWGSSYNLIFGGGYMSIRGSYLEAGMVNYSDINNLFPFDNDIVLCSSTGYNLKRTQFITGSDLYFIDWADDMSPSYNFDNYTTYYFVTDTYSSDFYTNENYAQRLEVLDFYQIGKYARDLLADFIRSGGWSDMPVNHAGTLEDPKTIREALEQASLYDDFSISPDYIFKGTVSRQASDIGGSGDLKKVYVKDAGTAYEIMIYYLAKTPDRSKVFESVYDLNVGDILIFHGSPFLYNGSTPEFSNSGGIINTYAISINGTPTL